MIQIISKTPLLPDFGGKHQDAGTEYNTSMFFHVYLPYIDARAYFECF